MIDLTKWHNWAVVAGMIFIVGFAMHELSQRSGVVAQVSDATGVGS